MFIKKKSEPLIFDIVFEKRAKKKQLSNIVTLITTAYLRYITMLLF